VPDAINRVLTSELASRIRFTGSLIRTKGLFTLLTNNTLTGASLGTSKFLSSLCNLRVLCVSVVGFSCEFVNHRDTENTEVAQRRHGEHA
jgi:hypothetical protein